MADRTTSLLEAIRIMARLRGPDGCPWDREQTFESIKRHTLEETYEVFDAIERNAWPELKDELGDLLLQVLFYAQMAEEAGYFTIEEVAASLSAKLIRRHPHVFGDVKAASVEEVHQTWAAVKAREKAGRDPHFLDKVTHHQPAFLEAAELGKQAAKVGFDWPDVQGVFTKLVEEVSELKAEVDTAPPNHLAVELELGDLLFTAANLARHLGVEPEFALRKANVKFRKRFNSMEDHSRGPEALKQSSPDELETLWREAKLRDLP